MKRFILLVLAVLAGLPAAAIAVGGTPMTPEQIEAATSGPFWQKLVIAMSPVLVTVFGALWRAAKREVARRLAEANIQADALHALALAIERASERGPDEVPNNAEAIKAHARALLERLPAAAAVVHAAAKGAELQVQEEVGPLAVVLPMHPVP